jgi:uncharacterized membrane protein
VPRGRRIVVFAQPPCALSWKTQAWHAHELDGTCFLVDVTAVGKNAVPSLHACALACLLALLVLVVAGIAQADRGLWQDEATLLANMGQPLSTYFVSLPYYDQAAPPLALLIIDGLYLLTGGSVMAMRLLLLTISFALFAASAMTAWRREDRPVLLAIAALAVTPLCIRYAVELKQYVF